METSAVWSPACQICWLTQGSGSSVLRDLLCAALYVFFVRLCVRMGLSGGTQSRSVFLPRCVLLVRHVRVYLADERACCTISTNTFLVSVGLRTSRKNAMRAPRTPSGVFNRT